MTKKMYVQARRRESITDRGMKGEAMPASGGGRYAGWRMVVPLGHADLEAGQKRNMAPQRGNPPWFSTLEAFIRSSPSLPWSCDMERRGDLGCSPRSPCQAPRDLRRQAKPVHRRSGCEPDRRALGTCNSSPPTNRQTSARGVASPSCQIESIVHRCKSTGLTCADTRG
jgi:hypothetical protein